MATGTSARRTQAERSQATRAKVLDAAVACLADRGLAATTTTEVARRAQVSRGALLHQFPTRGDLVDAAARHVLGSFADQFAATMGALPEGPERIRSAIDLLAGIFDGPVIGAWYDLILAGRTDPELQAHVGDIYDELAVIVADLWADLFPAGLGDLGPEINDAVPALLFAVLHGNALRAMTGSSSAARHAQQSLDLVKVLAELFGTPAT